MESKKDINPKRKKKKKITKSQRIALLGLLSAVALILGFVEVLIPLPFVAPGVKLGLGNIAVLLTILLLGPRYGFVVMLIKVIVSTMLFGNPAILGFSLSGGVLSFLIMWGFASTRIFSIIGISIAGSIAHNLGQLIVVFIVYNLEVVLVNLPILLVSGVIMGFLTGIVTAALLKAMENTFSPLEQYVRKPHEQR